MLDLSTAVLCDFAQVRDRLLFVASGAVSRLYRRELPSPLGLMVGLVIEVPLEDAGMEHGLRAEVINRHGTVLATLQNTFRVSDEGLFPHEVQQVPLVLSITGVRARTWGTHQVRLYLDDELVRALTLYVVPAAGTQVVQAPPTPAQATAEGDAPADAAASDDEVPAGGEEAPAAEDDAPEADEQAPDAEPDEEEPDEEAPVPAFSTDEPDPEPEAEPEPEPVREPAFGAAAEPDAALEADGEPDAADSASDTETDSEPDTEADSEPEAAPLFSVSAPDRPADPPRPAPPSVVIEAERAVPSFEPSRFEAPQPESVAAADEPFDFDADDLDADPPAPRSDAEAEAEEKSRFAFRYRYDE